MTLPVPVKSNPLPTKSGKLKVKNKRITQQWRRKNGNQSNFCFDLFSTPFAPLSAVTTGH